MGVLLGGLAVALLLIAAVATAWTPIFALLIFAVIAMVLLALAALRRAKEATPGSTDHAGDPVSYAAPADGEGAGARTGTGDEPEPAAPRLENEPAGIWGEKR